ncbi:MAG: response regulator transcription factor [Hymenobacteraceae bacterium]|nr:response regulator transcription factor [Hymenobacteraceae bacterium]
MTTAAHILLVEDDPNFGAVLRDYLELHDYQVTLCKNGNQGLIKFKQGTFQACILDVMMPEKDGFTLAKEIKAINQDVPIIFLTAKSLKADILEGFKIGADDYLTKPFDSEIMLYKLKAILQRKAANTAPAEAAATEIAIGAYVFKTTLRTLQFQKKEQKLSPKEAALLELLCRYRNQVLHREEALLKIWHDDNYFNGRSMDVYIARLRKYLKEDPQVEIINIHGNGFRLVCPEPVEQSM